MNEAFENFKFKIGDVVRHASSPTTQPMDFTSHFIVLERLLVQDSVGISRAYCIRGINGLGGVLCDHFEEIELEPVV